MTIDALRTPDEPFYGLPDWPYEAKYIEGVFGQADLRLHYIDEGPRDAEIVLCLHGAPTWSYLYRKMIPIFLEAGKRVITLDWFGFGRSDKPIDQTIYTFSFHRDTLTHFIDRMQIDRCVLVCQDWGGLLGLTLPVTHPKLLSGLVVMNTTIATGHSLGPGFEGWRTFISKSPDLDVGRLMQKSVAGISVAEAKAYSAPFPDSSYKAGVRAFPTIVPTTPDMDGVQYAEPALAYWTDEWAGWSFMGIGLNDPIFGLESMMELNQKIRACPKPMTIAHAGHFTQEHGDHIARAALAHQKAVSQ